MKNSCEPYEGIGFAAYSFQIMEKVYREGKQQNKTPHEISLDIKNAYPWDSRTGWRYKRWLETRRDFFAEYGLPSLYKRRSSIKELANIPNQL